ncbi:MAG: PAS domain S-box protein [Dissulfurispiraceae bacterium]
MKKRIIIGLAGFSTIFFLGGLYIVFSINQATSTLDRLIVLHQVEIMREHLLIEIKKVQTDLDLKNTRYARGVDIVVEDVANMDQVSKECLSCHHEKEVENRLHDMERHIELYKNALSRVLTIRADESRMQAEEDNAFKIGEELVGKVSSMIAVATVNLSKNTETSLRHIRNTKYVLYGLVGLGPFLALGLSYVFIGGFTKPIRVLLDATRRLKGGDLDHRIEGLKDEFGELASSFNEMARELTGNMKKLSESEKRYRMLFESAADAIFIIDAEGADSGRIVTLNGAAAEMHGYTKDDMIGMSIGDLDTLEDAAAVPDRIDRMIRGEWLKEELTHKKKDGTEFPVEVSAGLLELDGHKYILAFDRDITERKKVEEALRLSEEKFSKAFWASPDWITISMIDEGQYIEVNDAFERLSGYRRNEVIGHTSTELGIWADPKERESIVAELKKKGALKNREVHFRTKSGNILTMLRSSEIIDYGGISCTISVTRDVTELRKAELMMQRAEQLKTVAEIAVGLAHEIKNPLAGMKAAMEVLHAEGACSEDGSEILVKVISEIRRIEMLLKDLLNFARPPKPQLDIVDINPLLDATLELSANKISIQSRGKVAVVRDFDESLPPVMVDGMQMRQVFVNLFLNAIDEMPGGGTLTVRTSHEKVSSLVKIEVADTGKGIDADAIGKIFQPFFTTKAKGTGMGLAISKRLIEDHGGTITLSNVPEGGTLFTVRIPVAQHREVGT